MRPHRPSPTRRYHARHLGLLVGEILLAAATFGLIVATAMPAIYTIRQANERETLNAPTPSPGAGGR